MANSKYPSNSFPVERLWQLYDFDPLSGYLISRTGRNKGKPVMGKFNESAWLITLYREDGSQLRTNYARVVFAWCNARWPEGSIDHKNRDIRDNRIWNLREADDVLQSQNRGNYNYGSYWNKQTNRWQAQIQINGEVKFLGRFDSQREAQEVFIRACDEVGKTYLEPVLVDGRYVPLERLQ